MANTPRIRFKGFTDDWEQRKLGECAIFNPKSELPDIFEYVDLESVVGTNILCHRTENKSSAPLRAQRLAQKKDVFYQTVRPYQMNNCIFENDEDNWVFSTGYAQLRPYNDSYFLLTLLQNDDFVKQVLDRCTGTSYPAINSNDLADIDVSIPLNENEQKKIGGHFRNLDHLITLHQRKCDETKKLKKFMLQKMFPKNGEKNPEIRFAGFTDDWEQRKLGEICERLTRKNKDNESDLPLTISSQHGLIDQRDFFNKVVAAKDMSEYYLLQNGEFAYNKSYSNGYDYGSIKRLNSYEKGCLSTLYICFKLISDKVNSDYLECYFDTLAWYHDVSQICSEGARNHGLLNVDVKAFFTEVTVKLPVDVKEQQQISAILHSLDHLITLHQRKCDNLKLVKKFMLQNMFPKKG